MAEQQTQESASDAEAPSTPRRPRRVVLIGMLVGGLVAGVAAGLVAIGPMVARSSGYVVTAGADSAAAEGEGGHGEGDGEAAGRAAPSVYLIDNMVLNPAGSGGTRFLMLATAVEFSDGKYEEEMRVRDVEVRDVLLRVVGARTVEELAETSFREKLRRELADSLSQLFPKAERKTAITRVFFPQFVIQ
ncbi:MAG: flagellar basal body-associated FliL family protein [Gemmatimonadota bacterium]